MLHLFSDKISEAYRRNWGLYYGIIYVKWWVSGLSWSVITVLVCSSDGNGDLISQKWLSVLNHVINIHEGHVYLYPRFMLTWTFWGYMLHKVIVFNAQAIKNITVVTKWYDVYMYKHIGVYHETHLRHVTVLHWISSKANIELEAVVKGKLLINDIKSLLHIGQTSILGSFNKVLYAVLHLNPCISSSHRCRLGKV